jgi:glutathione S-transferase
VLKLYRAPFSTNVERVLLALAHKRLSSEPVWISYEDRSPVEAVSGQPLVPVLVDGDRVIVDSMAIVAHLERRFPDPPLYPAEPARRAELEVFVDWFNRVWKVEPNALAAELEAPAPDPARVASLAAAIDARLSLFESLLDGRDFLIGEFSAADCCAYPFLKYAARRDPEDDELFHRILDEHQRVDGRPNLAAWIARVGTTAAAAA